MKTSPAQFSLSTLLGVVTCVALLSATAAWVLEKDLPRVSWHFPVLFYPSIPMMKVGILVVPIVCFAIILAALVLTYRSSPRALSSLYFFGTIPLVFGLRIVESPNCIRWLMAISVGSLALIAETLARRLPKQQLIAALLSAVIPIGAYVFLLSAIAAAGV